MVEAAVRGEIEVGTALDTSLTYCLACRACETACPSGVQYHRILDAGRNMLAKRRLQPLSPAIRQILRLVRHPRWLRRMSKLGNHLKRFPVPSSLQVLLPLLGYKEHKVSSVSIPRESHGSLQFFEGCVMSAVFPDANQAAKNLLQRGGFTIDCPTHQQCCGALHLHAGQTDTAKELAKQNILAFEASASERPIVNTAGGCGAMLMEYGELFREDPQWADRAWRFSARIRDWTTVFRSISQNVPLMGSGERVTLQNSCHLVNVEHAGQDSVFLAQQVFHDIFVALPSQDSCCGSAGVYNITHPEWAQGLLDKKMVDVSLIRPDRILVNNPGCHLQMRWGAEQRNHMSEGTVEHLATYLDRAATRAQANPVFQNK